MTPHSCASTCSSAWSFSVAVILWCLAIPYATSQQQTYKPPSRPDDICNSLRHIYEMGFGKHFLSMYPRNCPVDAREYGYAHSAYTASRSKCFEGVFNLYCLYNIWMEVDEEKIRKCKTFIGPAVLTTVQRCADPNFRAVKAGQACDYVDKRTTRITDPVLFCRGATLHTERFGQEVHAPNRNHNNNRITEDGAIVYASDFLVDDRYVTTPDEPACSEFVQLYHLCLDFNTYLASAQIPAFDCFSIPSFDAYCNVHFNKWFDATNIQNCQDIVAPHFLRTIFTSGFSLTREDPCLYSIKQNYNYLKLQISTVDTEMKANKRKQNSKKYHIASIEAFRAEPFITSYESQVNQVISSIIAVQNSVIEQVGTSQTDLFDFISQDSSFAVFSQMSQNLTSHLSQIGQVLTSLDPTLRLYTSRKTEMEAATFTDDAVLDIESNRAALRLFLDKLSPFEPLYKLLTRDVYEMIQTGKLLKETEDMANVDKTAKAQLASLVKAQQEAEALERELQETRRKEEEERKRIEEEKMQEEREALEAAKKILEDEQKAAAEGRVMARIATVFENTTDSDSSNQTDIMSSLSAESAFSVDSSAPPAATESAVVNTGTNNGTAIVNTTTSVSTSHNSDTNSTSYRFQSLPAIRKRHTSSKFNHGDLNILEQLLSSYRNNDAPFPAVSFLDVSSLTSNITLPVSAAIIQQQRAILAGFQTFTSTFWKSLNSALARNLVQLRADLNALVVKYAELEQRKKWLEEQAALVFAKFKTFTQD